MERVRRGVAVTTDRRVEASNKTDGLLDRVTREWIEAGLDVLFFGGGGFVERLIFEGLPTGLVVLGGDVVGTVATGREGIGTVEGFGGRGRGDGRSTRRRLFRARKVFDDRLFISIFVNKRR